MHAWTYSTHKSTVNQICGNSCRKRKFWAEIYSQSEEIPQTGRQRTPDRWTMKLQVPHQQISDYVGGFFKASWLRIGGCVMFMHVQSEAERQDGNLPCDGRRESLSRVPLPPLPSPPLGFRVADRASSPSDAQSNMWGLLFSQACARWRFNNNSEETAVLIRLCNTNVRKSIVLCCTNVYYFCFG